MASDTASRASRRRVAGTTASAFGSSIETGTAGGATVVAVSGPAE
jgi:hypothetical protein